MLSPEFCDACVVFGDSISQTCMPGGFYQRLTEYYERRLDVLNRGLAGYNTDNGLLAMDRFLQKSSSGQIVRLITIWFGANDGVLPPGSQHVPVGRYKENLRKMIHMVKDVNLQSDSSKTDILLITPPPFLDHFWRKQHVEWALRTGYANTDEKAVEGMMRTSKVMKTYVEACLAVGKEEGIDVLDIYLGMIRAAGSEDEDALRPFFTDGLHLTSQGYQVVFDHFTELIESKYPHLDPKRMCGSMPDYSEFGAAEDHNATIDKSQKAYLAARSAVS